MTDWIFDEDINRSTVDMFSREGIKGIHTKYDLGYGGIDDKQILQLAKKEKKTLITANYKDFLSFTNVAYHNTYGTFILKSDSPTEQVELVLKTIKEGDLDTKAKRREKKVYISKQQANIKDVRSNREKIVPFKNSQTAKKRKSSKKSKK